MALLHMEPALDDVEIDATTKTAEAYGATSPPSAATSPSPSASASAGSATPSLVTHRASAATGLGKVDVDEADEEESKTLLRGSLASSLLERYHQATATKMYEVEELVDFYFHRRLAAVAAVVISYLPFVITPNQITLFGLALGWASALCLYDSEFHAPLAWQPHNALLAAGLLMFAWIVSDCADGQVARLCKRGTRTGRILDGFVDGLVIAPNCWVLGLLCGNRYGAPYFYVAILAGVSLWLHAIIYDKIKNTYTENAQPFSECDGETVESVKQEFHEAKAKAPWSLEAVLLGIYVVYLTAQNAVTSDAASQSAAARHTMLAKCDEHYHASYIQKYSHVVRVASFMGISAHVTGLYVAYLAAIIFWDALFYVQLYFLIVLNAVLLVVLYLYFQSGMATQQPVSNAS